MPDPQPKVGYFYRLIPPRRGFESSMSPDERATMMEHGAYLRRLCEQGSILGFGPVGDPDGAYGIAILLVAGRAEAEAIRDGDPAVRSPHGFRGEVTPMLSLVTQTRTYEAGA